MPAPMITSTKNPRVRAAAALRDRRDRDAAGCTLVDGVRELSRALDGRAVVVEAFVDATRLSAAGSVAVERAAATGATVTGVAPHVLDSLAYGDRAEGVVAVVRSPDTRLASLDLPPSPLVVVVEAIEKPGNLGAILRSADAAGADAVIAADARTDLLNPNVVRASQGTVFSVPIGAASADEVRSWLHARGIPMIAARVDGALEHVAADLRGPVAIVLGSEAEGLSDTWAGPDVTAVRIPMHGVADSLNVSVTAAVLLYEARRQRDAD